MNITDLHRQLADLLTQLEAAKRAKTSSTDLDELRDRALGLIADALARPPLDWRLGPGSQPVEGVVHDQAFGNVLLLGVPVTDEMLDEVLCPEGPTCEHSESKFDNGHRCMHCEAPFVHQILSQTKLFEEGPLSGLRVTPEMALRVVWLRRARREWSRELA